MFKKILIAAGTALSVAAAALTFQSPANALDLKIGIHAGNGFHGAKHKGFGHHGVVKHKKRHFIGERGFHKPGHNYKRDVLTNGEIRYSLRNKGLYNIRFIDRQHSVVKVIADNRKGYVGKYKVNARNGQIIDGHVLRYHNAHRTPRGYSGKVGFFVN